MGLFPLPLKVSNEQRSDKSWLEKDSNVTKMILVVLLLVNGNAFNHFSWSGIKLILLPILAQSLIRITKDKRTMHINI